MRTGTIRQSYLYLVARLSELASEFTHDELTAMLGLKPDENTAIAKALRALADLHDELPSHKPDETPHPATLLEEKPKYNVVTPGPVRTSTSGKTLIALLSDESVFPKIADIAYLVPESLAPRDKESRARFAKRVSAYYESLPPNERKLFTERLRNTALRGGFVHRWSSAIKDL